MKPRTSVLVWFLAGLGLGLIVASLPNPVRWTTSLTSLSPDDRYRVRILDPGFSWVDRNFRVQVKRRDDHSESTIFRSPDELPPPGRERIVWSQDGKRFVIVGRGFYVVERPKSPEAEVLYLMADVESGQVWCNADQETKYPRFTCSDLPPMRWGGPCPPVGPP